jgi:hypothetical protein
MIEAESHLVLHEFRPIVTPSHFGQSKESATRMIEWRVLSFSDIA